jgi:hypothetical protein
MAEAKSEAIIGSNEDAAMLLESISDTVSEAATALLEDDKPDALELTKQAIADLQGVIDYMEADGSEEE